MYGVAGVLPSLKPPAPPPPAELPPEVPVPPPPPTTKYETLLLAGVGAELILKVPVLLNVCILKSPEQLIVPPVAQIKSGAPLTVSSV